ncbi:MAG: GWxTD domain-containing protein [bacterium]
MVLFILFISIKWQVYYEPISDSLLNMNLLLEIPAQDLRFVTKDSISLAAFEVQAVVYDKNGNQIAGDYWLREKKEDTTNFYDSLNLIIPASARRFNLRVIDLQGAEILSISENIKLSRFFANIRYHLANDSLIIGFTVINSQNLQGEINVYLQQMKQSRVLKSGVYGDTIIFLVSPITKGTYELKFAVMENSKQIDLLSVPVEIDRPFYLDETMWQLRVDQLEYIATPNDLKKLRKAPVEARDSLWNAFWKQYDPTPNTAYNEKEAEYFERIDYAEQHFSFGDKGWRSDRGQIYVKLGPPDEIQSRPYELSSKPYEVWFYYRLNLKFIFYDRDGFGEYILINPSGERI